LTKATIRTKILIVIIIKIKIVPGIRIGLINKISGTLMGSLKISQGQIENKANNG